MALSYPRRRALEWIRKNEPVSLFPLDGSAPQIRFVRRLVKDGLVEHVTRKKGAVTEYALSTAGRAALEEVDQ